MPGTTAFPGALDTFPDIGPNTKENAAGFEHDVVHNNEAAAIAALQGKVGVDGSADPDSLDARVAAVESGKLDASAIGSTVASLVSGKVPSAQLPSYVDDVLEAADAASLPTTGETGKIYITLDDNAQYRWSGSAYVELVASPGSTDAVPEGTTNLYFTDPRAYEAVKSSLQAGTHSGVSFTFNDGAHSISVSATADVPADTDGLDEGDDNLYFTDARAYAAAKAALQAGTHSGVSFAFDDGAMSISVTATSGGGSSGSQSALSSAILALSPALYYKCDEAAGATTLSDSSGNGMHLTIYGSCVTGAPALIPGGGCFSAPASGSAGNGAKRTGQSGLTVPMNYDYTQFMVVMQTAAETSDGALFALNVAGETTATNVQASMRLIEVAAGVFRAGAFWEYSAGSDNQVNGPMIPNARVFALAIRKNTTAKTIDFFQNGQLVRTVPYANEPTGGTSCDTYLCGNTSGSTPYLMGSNFAHWNSALTAAQILGLSTAAGLTT